MNVTKKIKRPTLHKNCIICGMDFETEKKAKIYCDNDNCLQLREELRREAIAEKRTNTENLVIERGKFNHRTILQLQCAAEGPTGRCQKKFNVLYESVRSVYPKYCEEHANCWQRSRFEGKVNCAQAQSN